MEARRFLLAKSGYEVNILWLDSHGSCTHHDFEGSLYHQRFHKTKDEAGRVYALLCPNGLEESEWARVFVDDPPGEWIKAWTSYKNSPPKLSHSDA